MSSNNDLVNRYLQAINLWLPRAIKTDILAEISEDLHSQIDDRSAALGRPLNDSEIAEILKHRGDPVIVASAYLPQQPLMGPLFFQSYKLTLKIVLVCYLIPWLLWAFALLISAPHRPGAASALLHSLLPWWSSLLNTVAIITLVFYALDRGWLRKRFTRDWDPNQLPKVRAAQPRRRSEDIAGVVFGFLYCGWLLAVPHFPFLVLGPISLFVTAAPVWRTVYPLILILAAAGLLEAGISLLFDMPAWERPVFKLATTGFALWVVTILLRVPTYFTARAPQFQQYASISNAVVSVSLTCVSIALWIGIVAHALGLIRSLIQGPETPVRTPHDRRSESPFGDLT